MAVKDIEDRSIDDFFSSIERKNSLPFAVIPQVDVAAKSTVPFLLQNGECTNVIGKQKRKIELKINLGNFYHRRVVDAADV